VLINFYAPVQIKSFKAKPTNSVVLIASRNFIGQLMEKERVSKMIRYAPCILGCSRPTASRCPRCGRPMCEKHYTLKNSVEISEEKLSYCKVPDKHIGRGPMLALGIEA